MDSKEIGYTTLKLFCNHIIQTLPSYGRQADYVFRYDAENIESSIRPFCQFLPRITQVIAAHLKEADSVMNIGMLSPMLAMMQPIMVVDSCDRRRGVDSIRVTSVGLTLMTELRLSRHSGQEPQRSAGYVS